MSLEKKILIVEVVFVLGVLVYLFALALPNQATLIAGKAIEDSEHDYIFEVEQGGRVIISKNKEFASPIVLEKGESIILPPGVYYYKVENWLGESDMGEFRVESEVGLDLLIREGIYELENSGNVDLDVTGKKSGITTALEVGESKEVKEDEYEGEQNG